MKKHLVEIINEGRKPDKNSCLRRLEFMLRKKPRAKMPCRNFILGIRLFAIPVGVEDKLVGREKD